MFEIQVSSLSAHSLEICINSCMISIQHSLIEISAVMGIFCVFMVPHLGCEPHVVVAHLEYG